MSLINICQIDDSKCMHDRIMAVIYPLKSSLIQRFFDKQKDIYVKYLPHPTTRLEPGDKLLFYRTKSDKKVIGEATIITINFLNVKNAIEKYNDRIFLSKDELTQYSRKRTTKMLVLELNKIKKYNNPVSASKKISMTGLHLKNSEYKELISKT
jgi:hypothetical protein